MQGAAGSCNGNTPSIEFKEYCKEQPGMAPSDPVAHVCHKTTEAIAEAAVSATTVR